VSLEQQFYVLFPILILFRNWVIVALCAVIFLFFAFVQKDVWIWYNRADTLAVGLVVGLLSHTSIYRGISPSAISEALLRSLSAVVLLGFLLFGTAGLIVLGFFPVVPALVTITCGIVVLLASYDRGYLFPDNRLTSLMATIGERSFSIYLTHNLAMATSTEVFKRLAPGTKFDASWDVPMVMVALVFLVLFTEASYRLIEVPFRAYGKAKHSGRAFRQTRSLPQ
jgi:peptidoglycan/LPS O-acetylase OafA/YrhL